MLHRGFLLECILPRLSMQVAKPVARYCKYVDHRSDLRRTCSKMMNVQQKGSRCELRQQSVRLSRLNQREEDVMLKWLAKMTRRRYLDVGCFRPYLSMPRRLIFDSSVCRGIPSFAAAPEGPDMRPWLSARAASIISISRSARVESPSCRADSVDSRLPSSHQLRRCPLELYDKTPISHPSRVNSGSLWAAVKGARRKGKSIRLTRSMAMRKLRRIPRLWYRPAPC